LLKFVGPGKSLSLGQLGEVQHMAEPAAWRCKGLRRGVNSDLAVNCVEDILNGIWRPCATVDRDKEPSRLENGKDGDDVEGSMSCQKEDGGSIGYTKALQIARESRGGLAELLVRQASVWMVDSEVVWTLFDCLSEQLAQVRTRRRRHGVTRRCPSKNGEM
jgi:hypothetical protein